MANEKLTKKIHRSIALLKRHVPDIILPNLPTKTLYVGNSGIVCGVSWEELDETFRMYGTVEKIHVDGASKPYSFVTYTTVEAAERALNELQGTHPDTIAKSQVVFYLAYVQELPSSLTRDYVNKLPTGLHVLDNFISKEEEDDLWSFVKNSIGKSQSSIEGSSLKHRVVHHFGYEFVYGSNNVNLEGPFPPPIPITCSKIIDRIMETNDVILFHRPDQLTINVYEPGQGIPPHIDTHSAFEEAIISLSLISDIVMEFRHPSNFKSTIPVYLPSRSLAIMTGESRYIWKHGIAPRKFDLLPSGRLLRRQIRCSFTFRAVRREPCICSYPPFCDHERKELFDSDLAEKDLPQSNESGRLLEQKYVTDVYNTIASHFDVTRHSQWRGIRSFLDNLPAASVVLDVGCGNGKYLLPDDDLCKIGCDVTVALCEICHKKDLMVVVADGLHLSYADDRFDAAISVAVIHHFSTQARREMAVRELLRVVRAGGLILITVWAFEQKRNDEQSEYLKWGSNKNRETNDGFQEKSNKLSVHVNLTEFQQQDLLVPWQMNKRGSTDNNVEDEESKRFLRFYHVFKEGELEKLMANIDNCQVVSTFYEQGNWCTILRKLTKTCDEPCHQ